MARSGTPRIFSHRISGFGSMSISFTRMVPEGKGLALLAGLAWAVACGPSQEVAAPPAAASPLEPAGPLRVVSLSPASSNFLLAVGAAAQIVAVDRESSRIPALRELPVVDLARASEVAPDVILWPGTPAGEEPLAEALRAAGREVVIYQPHSLDEAVALCRDLGPRLVGTARARSFEIALLGQLASIGGASFGRPRPRVAAVIAAEPLEFAGGHSFVTDLIEIAGGRSVTHGGEELRIAFGTEKLKAFAPDLLLVVSRNEMLEKQRQAIQQTLPAGYRIEFFAFDADQLWTHEALAAAQRLRAVIEPLSDELERTTLRRGEEGG
jgi:ABC-type Fe3+-hydroxamate transport system substrate-binding protein